MIELTRSQSTAALDVRILGVGGAGCNVLDRLILDGLENVSVIALNSDAQALNASVAPEKIFLGQEATRGLGAGGDPEIGYTAAEEAGDSIQSAVDGANLVFISAGLGGGTGSGAVPLVAHFARQAGATVVVFATMPFSFEGKRRRTQAEQALAQIREQSDLVVCFENDRMGEASAPTAGVQQAFVAADAMLSASIRSLAAMVRSRGLVEIGLADLASALRQRDSRCLFGHGESDGANRAHEALERALKSPLMDRGRLLADAHTVLVHLSGGNDLTLNEVTVLMNEFQRHICDTTRIQFGLTTDARLDRRLAVTILTSTSEKIAETAPARTTPAPLAAPVSTPLRTAPVEAEPHIAQENLFPADVVPEPEPVPVPKVKTSPPKSTPAKATAKPAVEPAGKKEQKAEQMPLEAPSRGRFDKGEPTIVDGQDLDVPTFMRRNVKLK